MIEEISPNISYINNKFINKFVKKNKVKDLNISILKIKDQEIYIIDIENLNDIELLTTVIFKDYSNKNQVYNVNRSGLSDNKECSEIGSKRFCINSEKLSKFLSKIIKKSNGFPKIINKEIKYLKYNGVSSYFRFMRYSNSGSHYPHYDSDYFFNYSKKITSYSLVMYLSNCETGEICFIDDKTKFAKTRSDWDRMHNENEVFLKVKPKIGRIVLFSHDICHSVDLFNENDRFIIRGDLVFKEIKK